MPSFLTGDFNSPSHLDWTPAVVGGPAARSRSPSTGRSATRSPTRASATRTARCIPIRSPCRASPGRRAGRRATRTRSTTASTGCSRAGRADARRQRRSSARPAGPTSASAFDPWPTDHRGVVSTFVVSAGGRRPFRRARAARRVFVGDDARRSSSTARAPDGQRVAIVPAGGPASAVAEQAVGPPARGRDGDVRDAGLGARRLRRRPRSRPDARRLAQPVLAVPPGEPTKVWTSKRTYTNGEPIDVSWSNAPGMRWDWLAVYRVGPASKTPYATPGCNAGYCGNNGLPALRVHEDRDRGDDATFSARRRRARRLAAAAGAVRGALAPRRRLQLGGQVAALPHRPALSDDRRGHRRRKHSADERSRRGLRGQATPLAVAGVAFVMVVLAVARLDAVYHKVPGVFRSWQLDAAPARGALRAAGVRRDFGDKTPAEEQQEKRRRAGRPRTSPSCARSSTGCRTTFRCGAGRRAPAPSSRWRRRGRRRRAGGPGARGLFPRKTDCADVRGRRALRRGGHRDPAGAPGSRGRSSRTRQSTRSRRRSGWRGCSGGR